jgi:hypothetical protein
MKAKRMTKLYVAVLNKGWVRSELITDVLPKLYATEGIQVFLENLQKTWDQPISSNRNRIVKRFLATDCDYLLMLDDDVVPLGNPAAFCSLGKDIIGFPAKVRATDRMGNQCLTWVAYRKIRGTDDEYMPVYFQNLDDQTSLVQVDAIGTGAILIARHILEKLRAPFHTDFDADGILKTGTDFAFCRKAQKAGYPIYTAPQCVCEHFKEIGLLNVSTLSNTHEIDPAANKYDIPWGGMAISPDDWNFIRKIILDLKPRSILEFGSGLSTLLMSEYAPVIAYETNAQWAEHVQEQANRYKKGQISILQWNGVEDIHHDARFDLIFLDGPPNTTIGGPGRTAAFKAAAGMSDYIIVHDANRYEEAQLQQEYLQPFFALKRRSGYHQIACHFWERRCDELQVAVNN